MIMSHAIHILDNIFTYIKYKSWHLMLILIMQFCFIMPAEYSIVFVHLGNHLQVYLKDALIQSRIFNPRADIYLIANQHALDKNVFYEIFIEQNVKPIHCEKLEPSSAHCEFLNNSTLNNSFREGFWRKATERFFYLEEFMRTENLTHVFHLETDNMLYVNLQELLPVFKNYPSIAAIFDNDNRCIPGFIYFAHAKAIICLVNFIAKKAKNGLDDMKIIAQYKNNFNKSAIGNLPIMTKEYIDDNQPLKNVLGNTTQTPLMYCNYIDQFDSIFDGAALGQYLGGIDPRGGNSKPGFINERCLFNPSHFSYKWLLDSKNRKVPYIFYKNKKYRINNLHIHSKNLQAFRS